MPTLSIDSRPVTVPSGSTILQAAQELGIDIPTLCFLEGYKPSTSCLVCVVKLKPGGRVVPACGTPASEGMEVESETEAVHHLRRTALELLLSDHLGDCLAPCHFACPAHMDVPTMLRQISGEQEGPALATVKRDIAIPAILGRVCPKPCEKGCRRHGADGAVAVCQLKRFAADEDLASGSPYVPPRAADSGKRVAIIGAGPTGLSAAFFLAQRGHACTLFDDRQRPGGRLWQEFVPNELPAEVLNAEVDALLRIGIELRPSTRVGQAVTMAELRSQFDAVLIACGATAKDQDAAWEVHVGPRGVVVNKETFATNVPGVFAAGNAIRVKGLVVRSAADGKEAAESIDQYLRGKPVTGPERPFSVRIGRVDAAELPAYLAHAPATPRQEPADEQAGFNPTNAADQAARCLHCDCRGLEDCRLRRYAAIYGADPSRYPSPRRPMIQVHQPSSVIYEPGKCINCALCIQIVENAREPLGLSFVGRGFDVRIGVPFDRPLDEALGKVAAECVKACPTAALSFRTQPSPLRVTLPVLGQ